MAILKILQYPDTRLHKVARKVGRVDEIIRELVKNMAETMYAAPGIGLAATQVDIHQRIIVMDVSERHDQLKVFINPEIIARSGEAECEEADRGDQERVESGGAAAQAGPRRQGDERGRDQEPGYAEAADAPAGCGDLQRREVGGRAPERRQTE